jgi:hypothetical protein
MHAPPHFQITLRYRSVWRAAGAAAVVLTACAVAAWSRTAAGAYPLWVGFAWLVLVTAGTLILRDAWSAQSLSLRWDGQRWHLGPARTAGMEPSAGRLDVMMDLGPWMLLCFQADGPEPRPARTWLPVQRRGHEGDWHLLRATVYCARPASPAAAPF